jgi:DNA modification methylase
MKQLLKNGYKAEIRPSGHDISDKFQKDNQGAIPPNLLEIANTESSSAYLRQCKTAKIKPHSAHFPQGFAEFFIKFLTDEGDVVLDPLQVLIQLVLLLRLSNGDGYLLKSMRIM